MAHAFDYVCFSTWENDVALPSLLPGNIEVLRNKRPLAQGHTNRNLQRVSTIAGIRACKANGCNYVLKWRSDMLPTRLNLQLLLTRAHFDVPAFLPSRLVAASTRIRSVAPDWFSSLPDLFHFGHVDLLEMLWGDEGFDFSQMFNPPPNMIRDIGEEWTARVQGEGAYFCAEQELYAWLKYRLQTNQHVDLSHREIARSCIYPVSYQDLGICWLGPRFRMTPLSIKFRPFNAGLSRSWWSINEWRKGTAPIFKRESIDQWNLTSYGEALLNIPYLLIQILKQHMNYESFMREHSSWDME